MTVIRDLIRPAPREVWRSILQRRGGGWSPLALFSSGQQGVWFDPSDFATLFQDSAGTTPVTASGQFVGKILDKSGRGNHLIQATGSSRPQFIQDASGSYLLFDQLDDNLGSASGVTFSALTSYCAAQRWTGGSATGNVFASDGASFQAFGVTLGPIYRLFAGSTLSGGVVDGANHVVTGITNGASSSILVDKSSIASGAAGSNTATTTLRLGAAGSGAAQFFGGRIYGAVITDYNLSASDRATLETYLGAKAGLSI